MGTSFNHLRAVLPALSNSEGAAGTLGPVAVEFHSLIEAAIAGHEPHEAKGWHGIGVNNGDRGDDGDFDPSDIKIKA